METIKIDIFDFVLHSKEIQEQICCEYGKVNISLLIPSIRERLKMWQKENNVDVSKVKITINGKAVSMANKSVQNTKML